MLSMKIVYQHDSKDCGAACLCMIASFFKKKYPIQQVRKLIHTGQEGVNILNLVNGAEKIGLSAKAYEASIDDLRNCLRKQVPIIVHLKSNHFVVAIKCKKNHVICLDPGEGKVRLPLERFEKIWSGYMVTFEKLNIDQQAPDIVRINPLPLRILKNNYKILLLTFVMSLFLIGITICSTYIFQLLTDYAGDFDYATKHNDNKFIRFLLWVSKNDMTYLLIFMLSLFTIMVVISILRGKIISNLSRKIDITLLEEYVQRIIASNISNITSRMTGDYISRITDLFSVRRIISTYLVSFLLDISMFTIGSIFLCESNIKLYLFTLAALSVYMIVVVFFRPLFNKVGRNIMSSNATMQSYFKEIVQGIDYIKIHNWGKLSADNFIDKCVKYENYLYKGNMLGVYSSAISAYIEQVSNIAIIFWGFSLAHAKIISQGEVVTIYLLFAILSNSLKDILKMQSEFQNGVIALDRIQDIYFLEEEENYGQQEVMTVEELTVENVSFHYPGKEILLHNISFSVKRHQKIAITGENGSGKTTLIKLLLGLEKANSGTICINGICMNDLEIKSIRNVISCVPQNIFLFADSLWNNITMGLKSQTEEDIVNACQVACLDEFLSELPMGLATFVEENGSNFSAGQKQAIAIARAMVRKPDLLILDEATSNMDQEKEKKVIDNIMAMNISCIWITHNPQIIKKADIVVDISGGTI